MNTAANAVILKRNADWLEKMSVGVFAVGLFQGQLLGFAVGIACYFGSMYLTRKMVEDKL
jgi:hypothetical protein